MRCPIKRAAVDDQPADRVTVAADIFGGGIHHDRRAVLERPRQDWRRSVIDNQWDAEVAADFRDFGDRKYRKLGLGSVSA